MWLIGVIVALIGYLSILYLKKTSRMKKLTADMPSVRSFPVIGSALEFRTEPDELFQALIKSVNDQGPVIAIWIGPELFIVLSSVEDVKVVLSSSKIIKKSFSYDFLEPWLGKSLLTASGNVWHRKRKIITPSFHFQILESFIDVFNSNSSILVKKLKNEVGKPGFNIVNFINLCTLDVISEAAMGVKINAQKDESSPFVQAIHQIAFAVVYRSFKPWLHPDFLFRLSTTGRRFYKNLAIVQNFIRQLIKSKRKLRETKVQGKLSTHTSEELQSIGIKKREAFLDLLMDYEVEGVTLSDDEIREEVNTFMFAGHDTTTSAIGFTLYALMKHQDIQQKVVDELNEIFYDSDRSPTSSDLANMKYLERVIKEALRMWPSVPYVARDVTEDVILPSGYTMPKGSAALLFFYCLQNNSKTYSQAEEFNPDRFTLENLREHDPFAFCPFSAGLRNCIGQKFAMLEMKTVVSSVIRNFKILPPSSQEYPGVNLAAELILRSSTGINVRLASR